MNNITEQKLRHIVKEVVGGEFMKLRALLVPDVSSKEQADIEKRYKKPSQSIAKRTSVNI